MVEADVEIVNEKGLHARASAKLAQLASGFVSEVRLSHGGEEVDAKSILGLLLVGAPLGARVRLTCDGPDELEALAALERLIASKFEEGRVSSCEAQELSGRSLSDGFGRGAAIYLQHREMEVTRIPIDGDGVDAEVNRLREAIDATQKDVAKTRTRIGELFGDEIAGIFEAHRLILEDSAFSGAVETAIREQGVNAEWAVHQVSCDLSERFAQIEDETLRERGQDLRDVTRYLLRRLVGGEHQDVSDIEGNLIVLADELTPEETLRLGRQEVVGFVVEKGGRNSHSAIVARALSVPMIAGVQGLEELDLQRAEALVDGAAGTLVLHPTAQHVEAFEQRSAARAALDRVEAQRAHEAAKTADGLRVELHANVEVAEEMADVARFGAEGVGLYRSEFLYIERSPEGADGRGAPGGAFRASESESRPRCRSHLRSRRPQSRTGDAAGQRAQPEPRATGDSADAGSS